MWNEADRLKSVHSHCIVILKNLFYPILFYRIQFYSYSIAFKPAESGWGGAPKYSQNFDQIFGNKNNKKEGEKEPQKRLNDDETKKSA
jgi:hypothetical protein